MAVQNNPTVSARIPRHLRERMDERLGAHISEGDYIRDAIREKIERDTPKLYGPLLKGKEEVGPNMRERSRPRRTTHSHPKPREVE